MSELGRCVEWRGAKNNRGYGKVFRNGKTVSLHRWIWTLGRGAIPRGQIVMHRCDNPLCYRLDHLRLGTQLDNVRDMIQKGRKVNGRTLLTEEDVERIRRLLRRGLSSYQVSCLFSVAEPTITNIRLGRTWKA
jgi:hypothetical protein